MLSLGHRRRLVDIRVARASQGAEAVPEQVSGRWRGPDRRLAVPRHPRGSGGTRSDAPRNLMLRPADVSAAGPGRAVGAPHRGSHGTGSPRGGVLPHP